jgi:molybdopterin-guanine dinucleotide biosynthesis protein A
VTRRPGTRWHGEGVAAVVLAGGIGRRFGTDKARAEVAGVRLLDRALAATSDFSPVWVAAGTPERAATLKPLVPRRVRVVPDDRPGAGPIGGLATALRLAGVGWVAVLAVDLPLLDGSWWHALMAAADRSAAGSAGVAGRGTSNGVLQGAEEGAAGSSAPDRRRLPDRRGRTRPERTPAAPAVALRGPDGRWEPLAALYHTSLAAEAAARAAPGGDGGLQRFLTAVGAHALAADDLPPGAADALLNVNVPEDAARVERRWGERS